MLARPPSSPNRRFRPGFVPAALGAAIVLSGVFYALTVGWLLHMVQLTGPLSSVT